MAEIISVTGERRVPKNSLETLACALDKALTQDDDSLIEIAVRELILELKKSIQPTNGQVDLLVSLTNFHKKPIKAKNKGDEDQYTFIVYDREELFDKLGQAFPEIL